MGSPSLRCRNPSMVCAAMAVNWLWLRSSGVALVPHDSQQLAACCSRPLRWREAVAFVLLGIVRATSDAAFYVMHAHDCLLLLLLLLLLPFAAAAAAVSAFLDS